MRATAAFILGALAIAAPALSRAQSASPVEVDHADLRYGDLFTVSDLPSAVRERARQLVLKVLRPGRAEPVSGAWADRKLAAAIPDLLPYLGGKATARRVVVWRGSPAASTDGRLCSRLVRSLPAGAVVTAADLGTAPCDRSSLKRLAFDRSARLVRAQQDLTVGDVVRRPPAYALMAVRPGERLVIEEAIGPVSVERDVVALQGALDHHAIFVRGQDGAVFSAPPLVVRSQD